jgi:hypothetical protein
MMALSSLRLLLHHMCCLKSGTRLKLHVPGARFGCARWEVSSVHIFSSFFYLDIGERDSVLSRIATFIGGFGGGSSAWQWAAGCRFMLLQAIPVQPLHTPQTTGIMQARSRRRLRSTSCCPHMYEYGHASRHVSFRQQTRDINRTSGC